MILSLFNMFIGWQTFCQLIVLTVAVESKTREILVEDLLQEIIEAPYNVIPNEPERFVVSVIEQMKQIRDENKKIHRELQKHDRELKEIVNERHKMIKTIERLNDENRSLSRRIRFLSDAVMDTKYENKRLSAKVDILAKANDALAGTTKGQAKLLSTFHNNATKLQDRIMTDRSNGPTNDPVEEEAKIVSKRIVLHSSDDILRLVTTHNTEIQKLQTDVTALKNDKPKGVFGSTYVRWGKNNCSGNGTELVYSGYAAGSYYTDTGSAANYLCLSPDPLWGHYNDAHNADATVMGVEYEIYNTGLGSSESTAFFHKQLNQEDAPCSVCRALRSTVVMIPGRNQCYNGWTLEYKGYLVAGYYGHKSHYEYVCLDNNPDVVPGGHSNQNGALFYLVEGRCGSLQCPPYVDGRELTCVVCSK